MSTGTKTRASKRAAADGRGPVAAERKRVAPTDTAGHPGFAIFGGFLIEGEREPELLGTKKYTTYSEILANVAIVGAGVRFFLNLVAKAGWNVEPADDSSEAQRIADLVEEAMYGMTTPWHRVVRRAAAYKFYGFSLQEWTAVRRDDGVIMFADIEPRAQRTIEQWDTDEHGTVLGAVQRSPQTFETIYLPRAKLIYLVDDTLNDSPEGLGIFRHIAKSAHALQRYELLEGWGFERDLRGVPVGRAPLSELEEMRKNGEISDAEQTALLDPIKKFIKNVFRGEQAGLFLDSEVFEGQGESKTPTSTHKWGMELLQGGDTGQTEVAAAIERKNREIARVIGVEHLLLGSDGKGSYALSRDKTTSFGLLVDGALGEVAETYEADFLDPLFNLNGWPHELKPALKPAPVQYRDLEQITGALSDMASAGAVLQPDDPVINEVRDLIGLSHAPDMLEDAAIPNVRTTDADDPDEPMGEDEPEGDEVDADLEDARPGGADRIEKVLRMRMRKDVERALRKGYQQREKERDKRRRARRRVAKAKREATGWAL